MEKSKTINYISAYGSILLLAFFFQTAISWRVEVFSVRLSALTALTAAAAMFLPPPKSMLFAGVLGFLCDALAGKFFGLYTIPLLLLGWGAAFFCQKYLRRNLFSALFLYGLCYALEVFLFPAGIFLIFGELDVAFYVAKRLLLEGACSVGFLVLFYYGIAWLDGLLADTE